MQKLPLPDAVAYTALFSTGAGCVVNVAPARVNLADVDALEKAAGLKLIALIPIGPRYGDAQ